MRLFNTDNKRGYTMELIDTYKGLTGNQIAVMALKEQTESPVNEPTVITIDNVPCRVIPHAINDAGDIVITDYSNAQFIKIDAQFNNDKFGFMLEVTQ